MPLFKVSVESVVTVSAVVVSSAPTEELALAEVRAMQGRARVNWMRGSTPIGTVQAPYDIWSVKRADGTYAVSLSAQIPIAAALTIIADDEAEVRSEVDSMQAGGLIRWTYRGVPIGEYKTPIPTFWANQQPDIVTETTLLATPNPAFPGQGVLLSSDVTGLETPSGTVEYWDTVSNRVVTSTALEADAITEGLAHAQAVVTLLEGAYEVVARYTGTDGFQTSDSIPVPVSVEKIVTSVLVSPPSPPIFAGQSVSLTVVIDRVTPSSPPQPTGTLTLLSGSDVIASTQVTIIDGAPGGQFNLGKLAPATYNFTVQYDGDRIHLGDTSSPASVTVQQTPTTTVVQALALDGSAPDSFVYSQTVILVAVVTSGVPGTVPVGTVTFRDGATTLGTATLTPIPDEAGGNASRAEISTNQLSVGSHSFTAQYAGSASFQGSTSSANVKPVGRASTVIFFGSSNSPTKAGQQAQFTVSVGVSSPAERTPFQEYGVSSGVDYSFAVPPPGANPSPVHANFSASGQATGSISTLPLGNTVVTASFLQTTEFSSSNSFFPHIVEVAQTQVALVVTPNPGKYGSQYVGTATISPVAPATTALGAITGTVQFLWTFGGFGNIVLATVNVVNGQAISNFPISTTSLIQLLGPGTYPVIATFTSTNPNYLNSQGTTSVVVTGF